LEIVGTSSIATAITNNATLEFAEGNLTPFNGISSSINFFVYDSDRTLSITTQASPPSVVVTWPQSALNFQIQINTNANLNAGWITPTNSVVFNGFVNTFTYSFTTPQTFFRLAPP
jgi:hypothetical protein